MKKTRTNARKPRPKPRTDRELALTAATATIDLALFYLKRTALLLPRCALTDPETSQHLEAAIRQIRYIQAEIRTH